MFRNAVIYQAPEIDPGVLAKALAQWPLRMPGPAELSTSGFLPPAGDGEMVLSTQAGGVDYHLIRLGTETRMLPRSVVMRELNDRLDLIEAQRGRRPVGKDRARIKDELISELLPRAFLRAGRIWAWFGGGLLVVDATSSANADLVISHLRRALGTFPATPLAAQTVSARYTMTDWLSGDDTLPKGVELGVECELREPVEAGAIIRARRIVDLDAAAQEHIRKGFHAAAVQITVDDRTTFTLTEHADIKGVRFGEWIDEARVDRDCGDPEAILAADFTLEAAELHRVIQRLGEWFDLRFTLDGGCRQEAA